ncbi:CBS domain-containing protein [Nocardia tengchongensis]
MAELGGGPALIIADHNERMVGIITDQGIVMKCIARELLPIKQS